MVEILTTDANSGRDFRLRPRHDRRIRDSVPRLRRRTAISPSVEAPFHELGAPEERILLCPPGDPESMAIAIGRVLDDETLRQSLRNAATETARDYDWQTVSFQYLDLYREVIREAAQ